MGSIQQAGFSVGQLDTLNFTGNNVTASVSGKVGTVTISTLASTQTIVSLTGQTSDITTTNFTNGGTAGLYRVSYVLEDTTADLSAGAVTLTISWTDGAGATTVTATQVLTGTGRAAGVAFIQLASGNITYATSHTGLFGNAVYAVYLVLERFV